VREIKFRAWCVARSDWVSFSLDDLAHGYAVCHEGLDIDERSWSQCTGIKDKGGVEIYEGDILSDGKVVEYVTGENSFTQSHGVYGDNIFAGFSIKRGGYHPREIKVIGNIYENPELLER